MRGCFLPILFASFAPCAPFPDTPARPPNLESCRTQKRCHPERSEGPAFLRVLRDRSLRPLRFKVFRLDTHNHPAASAASPHPSRLVWRKGGRFTPKQKARPPARLSEFFSFFYPISLEYQVAQGKWDRFSIFFFSLRIT